MKLEAGGAYQSSTRVLYTVLVYDDKGKNQFVVKARTEAAANRAAAAIVAALA